MDYICLIYCETTVLNRYTKPAGAITNMPTVVQLHVSPMMMCHKSVIFNFLLNNWTLWWQQINRPCTLTKLRPLSLPNKNLMATTQFTSSDVRTTKHLSKKNTVQTGRQPNMSSVASWTFKKQSHEKHRNIQCDAENYEKPCAAHIELAV